MPRSGDTWTSRPQPPRPPSPRWRPRIEDSSAKCKPVAAETAVEPEPGRTSSDMVEIEVEVALPASDRELPWPTAAGGGDEGPEEGQMEPLPAPTGSWSSTPNSDSEELVAVESGTKIRATQEGETCPAANSDSEELVAVEPDMETRAAKDERCHASYSDLEELIPAATSRDERTRSRERRLSASGSRSSVHSAQLSPRARTVSRTQTRLRAGCVHGHVRTQTSAVLRHRSTLRLDDAGFASIKDVLDNPRIRSHRPTSAWLHYIIKANDKRRFALDETGTRVRAVQVPIDSSQLLRQLALGDFGSLVPAHGLHSTYFAHIPSIMQHGLLPGGRKGERFRRHIHLAMSRNPTAGLRSGSEVILEIDLARAHNSGCTFFVSENGVLLTEDVIPPPCIVHATRTDNGAVYELRKFRSAYKRVCAASSPRLPADMCLNSIASIAAISAQHMLPLFGRFTSRSRPELSSFTGLKSS